MRTLYLLPSSRTISAAEVFYDFKMLNRATIVGEPTRGSAHAGVIYRIDDHFGTAIPKVKPINPYSAVDWEGVGVAPDVKVKAADTLTTAVALAVRSHQGARGHFQGSQEAQALMRWNLEDKAHLDRVKRRSAAFGSS